MEEVAGAILEVALEVVVSGVVEAVCTAWTESSSTTTTAPPSASSSSSVSQSDPLGYTKRVTKAGYLVKEGHLWKSWKRRWFTLRGTVLTYHESCEHDAPLGRIELAGARVSVAKRFTDSHYGDRTCIVVEDTKNAGKVFYLFPTCDGTQTTSEEEQVMDWMTAIDKCQAKARLAAGSSAINTIVQYFFIQHGAEL